MSEKINPPISQKDPLEKKAFIEEMAKSGNPILEIPQEETLEDEQNYHFELIAGEEESILSLIKQLKNKIETGQYSALLSDDAGGRIPTLILRKIFNTKGPDQNLKTYFFVAGGWRQDNTAEQYLKKLDFGNKKVLIITENAVSGDKLEKIASTLRRIGLSKFDFALVQNMGYSGGLGLDSKELKEKLGQFGSQVFIGAEDKSEAKFDLKHDQLSGTRGKNYYSPIPEKALINQGDISRSREDIKLMSGRIIKKVWSEGNN